MRSYRVLSSGFVSSSTSTSRDRAAEIRSHDTANQPDHRGLCRDQRFKVFLFFILFFASPLLALLSSLTSAPLILNLPSLPFHPSSSRLSYLDLPLFLSQTHPSFSSQLLILFLACLWPSFYFVFCCPSFVFVTKAEKRGWGLQKKPRYLCPFFSSSYSSLPFLLTLMPHPLSLFLLLQPRRPPHLQLTLISVIERIVCSPAECLGRQFGCSQSNQLRSHRPRLPFNLWFSAWYTRSPFQLTAASIFIIANCSDRCVRTVQFIWRRCRHQGQSSHMWSKRKIHPQVSAFCEFTISVMSNTSSHFHCYLKAGDMRRMCEKLLTFDPSYRYETLQRKERERIRGCRKQESEGSQVVAAIRGDN